MDKPNNERKKKKVAVGNKKYIIAIALTSVICIGILLIVDTFNIPTKLGFNVSVINTNIWSILFGNIVVITLFAITFILLDKRNIEKDKLGKFAGAVTLLNTYKQLSSFLMLLSALIEPSEIEEPNSEEIISKGQIDYLNEKPFEYDEKIFELLQNGYIKKEQYEKYDEIMKKYKIVVFFVTESTINKKPVSNHLKTLKNDLETEIEAIEKYKESL